MNSYWDITSGYCSTTAERVAITVWILICIALVASVVGGVVMGIQHAEALDDNGWWLIGQILGGILMGIWSVVVYLFLTLVGGLALLASAELIAMFVCLIVGAFVYFNQDDSPSYTPQSETSSPTTTTGSVRRTMNEIREAALRGEIEFDQ